MQAKTSVSDYRKSGELSHLPSQPSAKLKPNQPKLVVVSNGLKQIKLKPGLY